jgi:hypothetical protein
MLAPLALIASGSDTAAALHDRYRQRLGQLVPARPTMIDDMLRENQYSDDLRPIFCRRRLSPADHGSA